VSTVKTRSAEATPLTAGRGRAFAIRKTSPIEPVNKSLQGPEHRLSDKDDILAILVATPLAGSSLKSKKTSEVLYRTTLAGVKNLVLDQMAALRWRNSMFRMRSFSL
jgi:hypothetical protein